MKIENQYASEVPIFFKIQYLKWRKKTKKKHGKQKWTVDFIFQRLWKTFGKVDGSP